MSEYKINKKLDEILNEFMAKPFYNIDEDTIRELIQEAFYFGCEVQEAADLNEDE